MLKRLDLDDFDFIRMPSMAYTAVEMVKTITIAMAMRSILLNNML
jgi:hypothetical protein